MKVVGLLLLSLCVLERGASGGEDETIRKEADDEVYDLVEQELMKRISSQNASLFEKETNQMFIRFLIELVKENNTASSSLRQADQNLQSYETQQQQGQATSDGQYGSEMYQQEQQVLQVQQQVDGQYVENNQVDQQQVPQYPQSSGGQELPVVPQQQQTNWQPPEGVQGGQGYPRPPPQQQLQGNPSTGGQQFYPHRPAGQPQQPGAAVAGQTSPAVTVPPYPYPYPPEAYPGPFPPTRSPETLAEVDKLIQQIFRLNISGILDQSLSLVGSNPVRHLGGGVLKLVFCDPISRLLGRCRGNDTVNKKLHLDNLKSPV